MKIFFKFYFLLFIFLLFSTCAEAFEYKQRGVVMIDYMPDLNYPESFKIINNYNENKISLNECVMNGIKLLEKLEIDSSNKSMTANDRKDPGKDFDNLYDFLALTYSNYDKLSPEALEILNSSIWGMGKFLNKQFTSEEISILHSHGKSQVYGKQKYYNTIDCFDGLVKAGKMSHGEAAVFMILINEYATLLPLNINLNNYSDYFSGSSKHLYGWITIHYNEIKKDKKAFRILQFIYDIPWNFKDRIIKNKNKFRLNKTDNFNSLFKFNIDPEYSEYEPIVKKAVENVYNIYLKIKQNGNVIEEPLCWKMRENKPKLLIITLKKLDQGINGETTPDGPIDSYKNIKPLTLHVDIDPKQITDGLKDDPAKIFAIYKTAAHEFYHAIQYTYTDISFDNWINEPEHLTAILDEGSAVCFSDIFDKFYNNKIIRSDVANYSKFLFFKDGYSDDPFPFFINVCENLNYKHIRYAASLFSYYVYQKHGITAFDKIFKNVQSKKNIWQGLTSTIFGSSNISFQNVFHDFHVSNALLHKDKNIYDIEDKLYLDPSNPSSHPLSIQYNKMINIGTTDSCSQIETMPKSATYICVNPKKRTGIDYCLTTLMKKLNPSVNKISVISVFNYNGSITYETVEPEWIKRDSETDAKFVYYTKRGTQIFNPEKFIIVISNITEKTSEKAVFSITCTESSTPDSLPLSYDRVKNFELSKIAGLEFKSDISNALTSWFKNCSALDSQIRLMISSYNGSSTFQLEQLKEKYKQLNVSMLNGIYASHDLRYQFYLRKNYIVNKIVDGASSTSVLEQLKRLKEYLDDINSALSKPETDKILSVIGTMVGNHSLISLTNAKNPMNTDWTDAETKLNDEINKIKNKIQTIWQKSPFFFSNNEIGDAYAAVGLPSFEINYQFPSNQPAPVNIPPNLRKEPFAQNLLYKISDTIKNFSYINFKDYLFSDICDPMDLKYFSIIKKHDYREEFTPTIPGTLAYFRELNEIAYFRINATKFSYEEIGLAPPDIIAAVSRKFECLKNRTIDSIISQMHKGEFHILNSIFNETKNNIPNDEIKLILDIVTKKIKEENFLDANNLNNAQKAIEIISQIENALRIN